MKEYKWATLGCGVIANQLAQAFAANGRKLYSVANRTHEKAVAFAEKYGIDKVYDQIDDVFSDDEVDIIYISTPHNTHISYLRKALSAGKHVLCEKSITLNAEELEEAVRLAEEHHVVLAEAMTIFHMPIYKELRSRMDTGEFGELRLLQMNFGSYKEYDMKNRFFNRNLAGGALLDIGVYALSFLRWFMSSKQDQILSQVKYAPTGVDEQASILLKNKEGEMATVILSLHAKQPKRGLHRTVRVSAGRGSYHHLYGRRSQRSGIRRFYRPGAGIRSGRYGSGCRRRGKPDASRLYDRCDGYDDLDPERLGDEIS